MGSSQNCFLAIAGVAALSVVACNLQVRGGTWAGAPPPNHHAQAACAGTICHFGEYCSEQNVCTVGCKTDETCGPLEGCVKAPGQEIGTCQERQEPAGSDGTAVASAGPGVPPPADTGAPPNGTATLGWGNKSKAPVPPTCGKSTRACENDLDCGVAAHCANELCYPNEPGCPCQNSLQCGAGGHCTDKICWENKPGVPCSTELDCGSSGHCTAGMCYENASGSPCSRPYDCGPSSACVKGTCN